MSLVLITREELDKGALTHYRTPGSKNGQRLYQYKDGSLTPLGRIHYGVGKATRAVKEEVTSKIKENTATTPEAKAARKAETEKLRLERHIDKKEHKIEKLEKKAEKNNKHERTEAEMDKDMKAKIEAFNQKTQEAKKHREEENKTRNAKLKDEIAEIRSLTDMELNKRIERLQKERTYAELVNQRSAYEQSPLRAKATKIAQDFAEQFARKALNKLGDEVLNKLMDKGRNGNNSNSGNNDNHSSNNQNSNSGNNSNGRLPKHQKGQIKTMAHQGKSIADIARSLGLTEDQVKGYMSAAGITINKS